MKDLIQKLLKYIETERWARRKFYSGLSPMWCKEHGVGFWEKWHHERAYRCIDCKQRVLTPKQYLRFKKKRGVRKLRK